MTDWKKCKSSMSVCIISKYALPFLLLNRGLTVICDTNLKTQ